MNLTFISFLIFVSIIGSIISDDVCDNRQCSCSQKKSKVSCVSKNWPNLANKVFPPSVVTLTLDNNQLRFDSIDDRLKIDNLTQLTELSINHNPLSKIPEFNNTQFHTISLQDTSLTSVAFPSSYIASSIGRIILSDNRIRTINEDDFKNLTNSRVTKLYLDSASLSSIDPNAFKPLNRLQSLSLNNNQLKTCEFLSNLPLLSSIKLDNNQFTSLPQELALKNNIKTYSFKQNLIKIIDESSPLRTWSKNNYTNNRISLANNSFDCCQSLWFIEFLNKSAYFVTDAERLTCATPSNYAGQFLIKLNPQQMNCGGIIPNHSWWTLPRIIFVSVGGLGFIVFLTLIIYFIICQKRTHSGYREIDGIDDPTPVVPTVPTIEHPFPNYGEENDDGASTYSTAVTRFTSESQAPTNSSLTGVSAIDYNPNPNV